MSKERVSLIHAAPAAQRVRAVVLTHLGKSPLMGSSARGIVILHYDVVSRTIGRDEEVRF